MSIHQKLAAIETQISALKKEKEKLCQEFLDNPLTFTVFTPLESAWDDAPDELIVLFEEERLVTLQLEGGDEDTLCAIQASDQEAFEIGKSLCANIGTVTVKGF